MNNRVEFKRVPGMAQYKGSDYANAVRVERGITVAEAKKIAAADPFIDYFVILIGGQMVLEFPPELEYDPAKDPLQLVDLSGRSGHDHARVFQHGDTVFFRNEGKWLGTAPGLADVYEKIPGLRS